MRPVLGEQRQVLRQLEEGAEAPLGRAPSSVPTSMHSPWVRLWALVRLGRPTFLLGGAALYALGALIAQRMGYGFDAATFWWGQLAVGSVQLMAQYSNDYFDLEADRANLHSTQWSGGSRVLVRGEIPRSWGLIAALACAAVAVLSTIVLANSLHQGQRATVLCIGLLTVMLALSWWYSSPPLRLHSRGLGELVVPLVVPGLTPLCAFVIQAGTLRADAVVFTLPLVLLQLSMLLTLQIPDREGDRAVGKRTWAVLFGVRPMVALAALLVITAFAASVGSSAFGAPPSVAIVWMALSPLVLFQLWTYLRGDYRRPRAFNRMAFAATAVFFLGIVADLLGLYLAKTERLSNEERAHQGRSGSITTPQTSEQAKVPSVHVASSSSASSMQSSHSSTID